MTKKTYLRPSTNVEEGAIEQMVCASLSSVTSTGLDDNESLDYGDTEGNREKNIWDEAW